MDDAGIANDQLVRVVDDAAPSAFLCGMADVLGTMNQQSADRQRANLLRAKQCSDTDSGAQCVRRREARSADTDDGARVFVRQDEEGTFNRATECNRVWFAPAGTAARTA